MKKLFNISTIALLLLSFMATSCNKETPAAAPAIEATTTWTPKGSTKPVDVKGDVEEGEIDAVYAIAPKLAACNCNGKWTYSVDKQKNTEAGSTQHIHNGTVTFVPHTWGTYKITITYTCPGGPAVSVTVSITVK
jgi:hypothetical protein